MKGVESTQDEEDDDTEEDDEVEMQSREPVRATTGSLSVILMISIKKKLQKNDKLKLDYFKSTMISYPKV